MEEELITTREGSRSTKENGGIIGNKALELYFYLTVTTKVSGWAISAMVKVNSQRETKGSFQSIKVTGIMMNCIKGQSPTMKVIWVAHLRTL
jgi:hypothetical protein